MNYKEKIKELMVTKEVLDQATKIFADFSRIFSRNQKKSNWEFFKDFLWSFFGRPEKSRHQMQRVHIALLIENDETLTEAHALRAAAQAFLKTLPEEMEPMEEFEALIFKMSICKDTLLALMQATRGRIAKMR